MRLHEFFPVYLVIEGDAGTGCAVQAVAVNQLPGMIPIAAAINIRTGFAVTLHLFLPSEVRTHIRYRVS